MGCLKHADVGCSGLLKAPTWQRGSLSAKRIGCATGPMGHPEMASAAQHRTTNHQATMQEQIVQTLTVQGNLRGPGVATTEAECLMMRSVLKRTK